MSARGYLALGSKPIAESKRLIPVSWLAFLSPDQTTALLEHGSATIERKSAIENFDRNAPFLAEITSGSLNFDLSEKLIASVRSSKARALCVELSELLTEDGGERDLPGIGTVIDGIANQDASITFTRQARSMVNPATGDMVMVKPIKLESTAAVLDTVCGITERWLQIADKDELESMVTGHILA
jgi:hypothetical protein